MRGSALEEPRAGSGTAPGRIEELILEAETELDAREPAGKGRAHWIAGLPAARPLGAGGSRLAWAYRGESRDLALPSEAATATARCLVALARASEGRDFGELKAEFHRVGRLSEEAIYELRSSGLVVL